MTDRGDPVNPYMIVVGRQSRGLSQKALAESIEVTQGRISKMESGILAVPDDVVCMLSQVLGYPEPFFKRQGSFGGVGIAELFHRKRQSVPKRILDQVYGEIEIRMWHIHALMRATDIACDVTPLDADAFDGDVEHIARLVRAKWAVPPGPIHDVTTTLEDAGILVIACDFHSRLIDAISKWVPTLPPVIFINRSMPKDRWRASLAHELGHIVMHISIGPDIEDQAYRFGAEFLLPEQEVRGDLYDLSLPKLAKLKQYWKVSMSMVLMRAQELGTAPTGQARYLWTQMAKAGYRLREPAELDIQGEEPTLLKELINTHRSLGYSADEIAELLALYRTEFDSLYSEDRGRGAVRIVSTSGLRSEHKA
jgi:Zn-dependent peptidase ImmA (M78 family)/transcriptional regulator with XRE-family HTH domain